MEYKTNGRIELLGAAGVVLSDMIHDTLTMVRDGQCPDQQERMIATASALTLAINLIDAEITREGVCWMYDIAGGISNRRPEIVVDYAAMEYVSGKALLDWVKKHGGDEG